MQIFSTRSALCVLAALALAACDDGDGAAPDMGMIVVGGAGGGGAGGDGGGDGDIVDAYCDGIATAKCEYVFKCAEGLAQGSTFGLSGPSLEECVAAEATRCLGDARDRSERGTLRPIVQGEIDACVTGLAGTACPPGEADDWVTMFYQFYGQRCTSVGAGNVPDGGDCERRTDCQTRTNICDGTCRAARPADIMSDCEATGRRPGDINDDDSCVGGSCATLVNNDADKAGICTVDCTEGFGCPPGAYCLRSSGLGGVASWHCTWPCEDDDDCQNGFECAAINPDEPADKHCAVRPPE